MAVWSTAGDQGGPSTQEGIQPRLQEMQLPAVDSGEALRFFRSNASASISKTAPSSPRREASMSRLEPYLRQQGNMLLPLAHATPGAHPQAPVQAWQNCCTSSNRVHRCSKSRMPWLQPAMASIALPYMGKRIFLRLRRCEKVAWCCCGFGSCAVCTQGSQTRRQDSGHGRFTLSSFLFLSGP